MPLTGTDTAGLLAMAVTPLHRSVVRPGLLSLCAVVVLSAGCGKAEPSRDDHQRAAESLLQQGDVRGAAVEFDAAAKAGPPDPDLLVKQADLFVKGGQWRYAAEPARAAADLKPDDMEVQLLVVRVLLASRSFDEAVNRATTFLEKHKQRPRMRVMLGLGRAQLPNATNALTAASNARTRRALDTLPRRLARKVTNEADAAAEAEFRQALSEAPDNMDVLMAWANFLVATGRMDAAEPVLRTMADSPKPRPRALHALGNYYRLRDRGPEAETYLKRATAFPNYPAKQAVVLTLADLYVGSGRAAEASALLASVPADQDPTGSIAVRLAEFDRQAGRLAEATARLRPLLARTPPALEAQVLSVELLIEQGLGAEAVALARTATTMAPTQPEARAALGRALVATGNLQDAVGELTEAQRLEPGDGQLALELASVEARVGRRQQALDHAREAVRLLPDDVDALAGLAVTELGQGTAAPASARRVDELLASHPKDPVYLYAASRVRAAAGDSRGEVDLLQKTVAADPGHQEAVLALVTPAFMRTRQADAQRILQQLIERRPGATEAKTRLAAVQAASTSRANTR